MITRTAKIFGTASSDAEIKLWIDDQYQGLKKIDHTSRDPFDPDNVLIYEFVTDVKAHGCTKIKLQVHHGQVCIGRTKARYPARTKGPNPVHGHFWCYQPMNPKYLVSIDNQPVVHSDQDSHLTGEWIYELTTGQVFEYAHLYYNGPSCWLADPELIDLEQFKTVGIFDSIEFIPDNVEFGYKIQQSNLEVIQAVAKRTMGHN